MASFAWQSNKALLPALPQTLPSRRNWCQCTEAGLGYRKKGEEGDTHTFPPPPPQLQPEPSFEYVLEIGFLRILYLWLPVTGQHPRLAAQSSSLHHPLLLEHTELFPDLPICNSLCLGSPPCGSFYGLLLSVSDPSSSLSS